MNKIVKELILFLIGGCLYVGIELLFRGRCHWSMALVGGLCFVLIGGLNNWFPWCWSILRQMAISAGIVTAIEFLSGIVLNLILKWNVWDYSNMPFNVLGQICLPFTAAWFALSFVAIVLDDFLRHVLFGEQVPEYHLFTSEGSHGK